MTDCCTEAPVFNAANSEQQTLSGASLFQDLKLKRRRVLDLLNDSEAARPMIEAPDSDQQSDISAADSAYVSDRGSESGAGASRHDAPVQSHAEDLKTGGLSSSRCSEEGGATDLSCGVDFRINDGLANAGPIPPGMGYRHGYLVPVPANVSHLGPNGVRVFPFMGLTPHLVPAALNNLSHPMFLPVPHNGYLFNSITGPAGSGIMTYPPLNNFTVRQTKKGNEDLQKVSPERGEPSVKDGPLAKDQEFVTHYTGGSFAYSGHLVENPHNRGLPVAVKADPDQEESEEEEEALVCAICCDRATGLHYGIVTCEGCKGFFKRTVHSKRMYTCVGDGDCEINKLRRNRCQHCRFRKCLQMGMVIAAVREDRMPGGRNSSAICSLYSCKMKYRRQKRKGRKGKHSAVTRTASVPHPSATYPPPLDPSHPLLPFSTFSSQLAPFAYLPPSAGSGPSLGHMTLPSPQSEDPQVGNLVFVPPKSDSFSTADSAIDVDHDGFCGSSVGKARSETCSNHEEAKENSDTLSCHASFGPETPEASSGTPFTPPMSSSVSHSALMNELAHEDSLLNIAEDYKIEQFTGTEHNMDKAMRKIGDDVMLRLVSWMRQLPFHADVPLDLQTQILSARWQHLLLLIMTAYGPVRGSRPRHGDQVAPCPQASCAETFQRLMTRLQRHLSKMCHRFFTMEHLCREVGMVMESIARVMVIFQQLNLTQKELGALQVILLFHSEESHSQPAVQRIVDKCQEALRHHILERFPSEANRFGDLLAQLSSIRMVSHYLLHRKMIYLPFLLNS